MSCCRTSLAAETALWLWSVKPNGPVLASRATPTLTGKAWRPWAPRDVLAGARFSCFLLLYLMRSRGRQAYTNCRQKEPIPACDLVPSVSLPRAPG